LRIYLTKLFSYLSIKLYILLDIMFRKADGRQFYHFVQSFSDGGRLTPQEANVIGLEFAAQKFWDLMS